MLTLVRLESQSPPASSPEADSLKADYLSFDRRRTSRRQYMKAFGGMAIIVLLGGAFHYVPGREALIVAGLLLAPPLLLAALEGVSWYRLVGRLNRVRVQAQFDREKSRKKVVSTEGSRAAGAGFHS